MDVSIIIVSWNVRDALKANLERLFSMPTRHPFEVIVIDNGSTDGTARMLCETLPQVHLIQNDTNRGFAYACNQGLAAARAGTFILFNPDMLMGEGAIDHAFEKLAAQRDIGVLGVKLTHPDGSLVPSVRRDPHLADQLAILLKLPHLFPRLTDHYLARDFDYARSQEAEQVRGSFFALRRDVIEKVGAFDADCFFVWFEEVDFCRRVRQEGYRVWYSSDVSCTDLVGQSFKQQPTWLKQVRLSRSMARYFRKWHPAWQAWIIYLLRPMVIVAGAIIDVFRLRSSLWK